VSTSLEGSNDLSALQFAESGQYLGLLVAPWSSKSSEAEALLYLLQLQQYCWTETQSSEYVVHQNRRRSSRIGTLHSRKLFELFQFISVYALKLPEGIH
jgi:hypothetical protein